MQVLEKQLMVQALRPMLCTVAPIRSRPRSTQQGHTMGLAGLVVSLQQPP